MFKKNLDILRAKGGFTYPITLLIMVILPIHYKYLPPFMVLLCLGWIFENYTGFGNVIRSHSKYILLLSSFFLLYFWQATSIIYTSDIKMGWSNVFGRLSLIIFPLTFFNPGERIRENRFKLLQIFAISTAFFALTCFGYALYRSLSFQNGNWLFNPHPEDAYWLNYFYGPDLTYSIHPSYLAMYVLISVFISFESYYDISLKKHYRIGWLILGVFLLVSVYFISSRAAILAAIIMIPLYSVNKIIKLKRSRLVWASVIIIMILLLPLIRRNDRVNNLFQGNSKEQKLDFRKRDERIIIWESAAEIIRRNLILGVGIGDVRTELVKQYDRIGEEKISKERLNAHNQFLEILVENGIIGFLIFLALLGLMVYLAVSDKNLLYGIFILMIFVFFMFETILYRLAGVAFFSLFSFILLKIPKIEIK
jgi:O-antigen ligase